MVASVMHEWRNPGNSRVPLPLERPLRPEPAIQEQIRYPTLPAYPPSGYLPAKTSEQNTVDQMVKQFKKLSLSSISIIEMIKTMLEAMYLTSIEKFNILQ